MTKRKILIATEQQLQYIRDNWKIPMNKAEREAIANHIGVTESELKCIRRKYKLQLPKSEFDKRYKKEQEVELAKLPKPKTPDVRHGTLGRKPVYKPGDIFIKKMMGIDYEVEYIAARKWKTIKRITPYPPKKSKKKVYKVGDEKIFRLAGKSYLRRFNEHGKWETIESLHTPKERTKPFLPAGTTRVRTNHSGIVRRYVTDGLGNWKMLERITPYKPKKVKEEKPKKEPHQRLKLRNYNDSRPKKPKDSRPVKVQVAEDKPKYIKPVLIKTDPQPMKIPKDNFETHRYVTVGKGVTILVPYSKTEEQARLDYAAKKEQQMLDIKNQGKKQKKTA